MLAILLVIPSVLAVQEPDSTRLRPVVITATRVDSPTGGGIAASTVIDQLTLRQRGVRDVVDALRLVPGVAVVQNEGPGSQTSVFMRGGENDYVRVLIDGVAVNEPGGAVDFSWLSVQDVDRIEVVRGPASVLYGTDAVSGVIQIFTRRGTGTGASADVTTGSYGTLTSHGSITFGGERGGVLLGASREKSDGLLAFNNQYYRTVLTVTGHFLPDVLTRASASLRAVDDEFHYPTDGSGAVLDRNAFRSGRRFIASLAAERQLTSRLRGSVSATALQTRVLDDDRPDSPADSIGFFYYDARTSVRRQGLDAHLDWRPVEQAILTVGTEVLRESQHGNDSSNYSFARNDFAADRQTRALYLQWLADMGPLSYTAGARYDDNDVYGAFRTWRSGLAWHAWPGGTVRAAFSTAFKAPSFLETFNTAFTTGNPELVPERSRSWEAGVRQSLAGERVNLVATWFSQRFRDMIQYAFVDPQQPNYFNVAEATARGLELEASVWATDVVSASASATLLRTRVEDEGLDNGTGATFVRGERLLRRPSILASGTLLFRLPGSATLDVTARYSGSRDDRDFSGFPASPVVLPAYTRLDAGVSGVVLPRLADGSLRATLRVDNVLGAEYQEIFGFPTPGRGFTLGLRWN